jgi:hypothetical protein
VGALRCDFLTVLLRIFCLPRYVDYPDPIQLDSDSSQSYGCNC